MRILTRAEVIEATAGTEASPELLTQRAGYAVAQFCIARFKFRSVCVVCGQGRNGAAGLAAAAVLERIAEKIRVIVLAEPCGGTRPGLAADIPQSLRPIWVQDDADLHTEFTGEALSSDLIIDAIVGTGYQSPLRPLASAAVAAINSAPGIVISVDVPSGIESDATLPVHLSGGNRVFAQGVIALGAPKPAHVFAELTTGPVAVSELGIQPAFVANGGRLAVLTGQDVCLAFPRRQAGGLAGDFGHVLVLGGARGKAGIAALAGKAAMSAGAGQVTVACPKSIEAIVAGLGAALFTHALPETSAGSISMAASGEIGELLAGKDAVILGPGLSTHSETAAFIRQFAASCQLPLIIDGDAVAAFVGRCDDLRQGTDQGQFRVLCLDVGDAARLIGTSLQVPEMEPMEVARSLCRRTGACIVMSGTRTIITGPAGETWVNLTGGPAMAKAGMREFLGGLIGASLARRLERGASPSGPAQHSEPLFHTRFWRDLQVAAAVHLYGVAGDVARDALHEHTLVPADLLEALSEAFRACYLQVESGLFYLRA